MKAYGYIRVSGAGQVDKDGPERQEDAIKGFRCEHNLETGEIFFERGVSGTVEGMDRPEFSRLIARIEEDIAQVKAEAGFVDKARIPAIVVERMDRLARDLMVQEFLLKECRERGIRVFATDQGALTDMASDGGDPTRKLIRQVLGALAEWEKSALVLKLRKARERIRAEKGRCEGLPPYGQDEHERAILRAVKGYRDQGLSLAEIAAQLNLAGMRTRFGKIWRKNRIQELVIRMKK